VAKHRNTGITTHLRAARRSFTDLDRALHRLAESVRGLGKNGSAPSARRRMTITPARRAALKLQGQYMGYLWGLKPKQKALVKGEARTVANPR
jgi:hypothetical protein